MASAKISLAFHNSSLSAEDKKKAETTGMLILASDFIQTGKVNRAEELVRISKIAIPLYLAKTKAGGYITINPFSSSGTSLTVTQLPSLSEVKDFCSDIKNLDLNKLYKKMMKFSNQDLELLGLYNQRDLEIIKQLLDAPRGDQAGFNKITPTRPMTEIKNDLARINEFIYDDKTLNKDIKERFDLIENALLEYADELKAKYDERKNHWNNETKIQQDEIATKITEREKKLKADIKIMEKESELKINENLNKFLQGVAKNIRTDEKSIEKLLQTLEKVTSKAKSSDDVPEIERILNQLGDATETFRASVSFAKDQVRKAKSRERDIREMHELDVEGLRQQSEIEKQQLRESASQLEAQKESELSKLLSDKDEAHDIYLKFKGLRKEWTSEIKSKMVTRTTAMLPASDLRIDAPGVSHELLVPAYLFQYRKNDELYNVIVPPINTPENMKKPGKNAFFGGPRTVFFDLVVPESKRLIAEWFEQEGQNRDLNSLIQQTPNLLDNPSQLRDIFFNSQSLMIDKLKVKKKEIQKANDRLTDVWTSG